ncbi:hypothetical protein AS156_00940 [Bradyrhizobium macuxiense]|uniref:Uncharacterized protein n=1 Tax=Bradyrhizobium macuxiense TaxID=1755647 RepID=A0A109JSI6_9BRAD|nr:DUF5906 domain-containing protein [Bradyrhizobium macuxiense]KWV54325.1 hypothetical protein AS156_00940 [Bradyrhizobium macuxiense]
MSGPDDAFEAWRRRALDAKILDVATSSIVNAKLRKKSREHVGPCPLCGGGSDVKGKRRVADGFAVNPAKGVFNCRRGGVGGDVVAMVMHTRGVPFVAACELIVGEPPPARGSAITEETRRKSEELQAQAAERERRRIQDDNIYRAREIRTVRDIYDRAHPFAGSSAEIYAGIRGLTFPPAPTGRAAPIKSVEAMPYHVDKDTIAHRGPAMVAPIINARREFQGLHFTYLDLAREKGKLQLEWEGEMLDAKKSRGSKQGNFVALTGPVEPEFLVIGEAIEKTTAVYMALASTGRDMSAAAFWSGCDLGNLAGKAAASVIHPTLKNEKTGRAVKVSGPVPDLTSPAIEIPDSVTDLVLLGDSTSEPFSTRQAMSRAAARYSRPGRTVRIAWAPGGIDFDDLLRDAKGDDVATAAALARIADIVDRAIEDPGSALDAAPPVHLTLEERRQIGSAELGRLLADLTAAPAETRMDSLLAIAEQLGELVAADAIVETFAKASLEQAAAGAGMIGEHGAKPVKAAIAAGLKAGKKRPRDLGHAPAKDNAIQIALSSPAAPGRGGDEPPDDDPSSFDIDDLNRSFALVIWGGKAVVVNEQPHGPVNDRVRLLSFDAMSQWFANKFTEVRGADGKVKPVTWATAWLRHRRRRQYAGVEFFPNPDGIAGAANYLNLWRGFSVAPSSNGSCEKFKDHLRVNVCQEDEKLFRYLMGWLAHLVQRPRVRAGVALVLRGAKGTGKTKVGEVIGSLFAPHYFLVDDARYLTGQFNSHMASCLLLQADEALWAGDKSAEGRLKGLITSEIQMVEAKGIDPVRMRNFVHVVMTSNESWVVPATGDERRFFVLDVGSLCQRNNIYFAEIDEELDRGGRERLLFELQTLDLDQFNIWDVPQTEALLDQKIGSLDPIDEFWHSRLHEGLLIHGDEDWRNVVARDDLYSEYLHEVKARNLGRARGSADFGKRIKKLAPEIRDTRPAIEKEPGVVRRTRCYEMPSLQDCRESFERYLGQPMKWPALTPDQHSRADTGGPDAGDISF